MNSFFYPSLTQTTFNHSIFNKQVQQRNKITDNDLLNREYSKELSCRILERFYSLRDVLIQGNVSPIKMALTKSILVKLSRYI